MYLFVSEKKEAVRLAATGLASLVTPVLTVRD